MVGSSSDSFEIVLCPPELRGDALALVLSEIAPSQRREIASGLLDGTETRNAAAEALYVALRRPSANSGLAGAVWGQRQPGNTAVLWPPRVLAAADVHVAHQLAKAAMTHLDRDGVRMTQVLLPPGEAALVPVLTAAGFSHLADLNYLSCEAERFPAHAPASDELEFVTCDPVERDRLADLVERTYNGTLDCVGLNGQRRIDDVLDGYRETGVFRAENWLIVQHRPSAGSGVSERRNDVGVLLLADHPQARHWELMYMGIVPEARGHGWGSQIARHAQWLARRAGAERIVLAVDAANWPALAMYERSGFVVWDRRRVFVRVFS
jgi:ribosomal protein S18 acetylase RimI-like enzyme